MAVFIRSNFNLSASAAILKYSQLILVLAIKHKCCSRSCLEQHLCFIMFNSIVCLNYQNKI
ncbi:hypothetical protein A1OE_1030 [Candidatus Endolissoclinum faulkneri L2]|uniref:Uncharacterized protein n=1 Tax=Candidatus Endolissoclinum faulkneri L2 TaxID=1193729 RepID=K7YRN0_9PROT|nr:hypothetical protein A1OE_1030 [Candidatus Endolissoclinum faulkneri L2]